MSRLDELIKELCPDGVEYKALLDVAEVLYGYPCDASKFNDEKCGMPVIRIRDVVPGTTRTFTTEKVPEQYYITDGDFLVGMDGNFNSGKWNGGKAVLCQRVCKFTTKEEKVVLNGYLAHYLGPVFKRIEDSKQGGTVKHLSAKDIKAVKLPVPPLEIQEEIVKILDKFTDYVTELQVKLQAELQARRQQYEFYKEKVLDENINSDWVPLLDVADTFTGLTYKPSDVAPSGTIVLRSSNIKNGKLVFDDNVFVCMENIPQRAIVEEDDILVCVRNGSKALIGKAAMIPSHEKRMAFGAFMTILRAKDSINPKYLYFVWQSPRIQYLFHGDSGMPINQITKKTLQEIKVPVPSLERQNHIVDILSEFDEHYDCMVNALTTELEVRQKQYKYYRDKLLTFKELEGQS